MALGQLGTAGQTLAATPLGATAFQQDVAQFMSPYQSQVIDASLAEFDRNKQMQEQQIRDQQAKLGVLGRSSGSVQLAEFGTWGGMRTCIITSGSIAQIWSSTSQLDNKTLQIDLV